MAYTPGSPASARRSRPTGTPAWKLTIKKNTVAVVSDGTAVLGLGDIGPEAAMPVMEGKAVLFKEFGAVDAFPVCVATRTSTRSSRSAWRSRPPSAASTSRTSRRLAASRSRSACAPRWTSPCSTTTSTARRSSPAALVNALKVVDKRIEDVKIVITGVGAAGIATADILLHAGARNVIGADRHGAVYRGRPGLSPAKRRSPSGRTRTGSRARPTSCSPARTSSSASRLRGGHGGRGAHDGRRRDRLRDGEPDARGRAGEIDDVVAVVGPGARTTPTRSTTCSLSGRLPRSARRPRERGSRKG